ncbi:hypothetical protein F4805DRAFT_232183 [Annulohypoxylon moriforme]|nr:hypothetical protein F4805DRAFT_232183 [Annulohypoxylon moriforme]
MEQQRRPSAPESATSSVYSTQTLPVPLPVAETARTSQTSFASRAWIFGKVPNYNPNNPNSHSRTDRSSTYYYERPPRRPSRQSHSHLEPVAIRDSVGYPSASSFEATIEKGTARFGRRNSTKPRLVDLGGLRRKVKRMTMIRRESEKRDSVLGGGATPATLREAFEGVGTGEERGGELEGRQERERGREMEQIQMQTQGHIKSEEREPENIRFSPPTDQQLATMMYHQTQNDIVIRTRTESPTARVPELPFRDKIRGKHFSRTTGNLEQEVASYARDKRRNCTPAQCAVI